jgi:hypothetical protein
MAAETPKVRAQKGEVDVNELLRKLRLSDAERDGVVLAKEARGNLPEVKWMAMARLLTEKKFSEQSLIVTMKVAWNTAREVPFMPISPREQKKANKSDKVIAMIKDRAGSLEECRQAQ